MSALLLVATALFPLPPAAAGVDPPEPFLVNEYVTGTQIQPSVAALADGGFVVSWSSNFEDGFGLGIFARVFDGDGGFSSTEFQVNAFTTCYQFSSTVSAVGEGFVVTWQSGPTFAACTQDGSDFGVFARVFDAAGMPLSDEVQVNIFTPEGQANPAVAPVGDGFVVVWDSYGEDGDGTGVFARVFDAAGSPASSAFRVNGATIGDQYRPAVTTLGDGGFQVVWLDAQGTDYAVDVFGRRFDASGEATTSDAQISEPALPVERLRPFVVRDGGHGVAVLWSAIDEQTDFDVIGIRLDANGDPAGDTFTVNTYTTQLQIVTGAAAAADGFIVVWSSLGQDGDSRGVFGRRMDTEARPVGPEFPLSAYTTGEQSGAVVTTRADGDFVAAWSSPQDASEYAIVAGRFPVGHALAECGDADANGTLTARDALLALRAVAALAACPLRTCDVDSDDEVTATDALAILRAALGLPAGLSCATPDLPATGG